jgi:hypothetical protein
MISFGLYKIAPFHHSKATMDRYNHKSITPIDIIYRIIYELICTQNGFQQKEIWTRDIVAPIKKKTKISVVKQLSFFFFFIKALFFFFFLTLYQINQFPHYFSSLFQMWRYESKCLLRWKCR